MISRKPSEVCITIDTEFNIGGYIEGPALTAVGEPMMVGSVAGKEPTVSAKARPHSRGIPTQQRHRARRESRSVSIGW